MDQPRNTSKDPLHVLNSLMTRSKTKTLKEALNALVLKVSTKSELKCPLEYQEETLVHFIHVQEVSNIRGHPLMNITSDFFSFNV